MSSISLRVGPGYGPEEARVVMAVRWDDEGQEGHAFMTPDEADALAANLVQAAVRVREYNGKERPKS